MMDAGVIDRIKQEMENYEAAVPGAKGGEDYPMFAAMLAGSEHMKITMKLGMIHMMFWLMSSHELNKLDPRTMARDEVSATVDKIIRIARSAGRRYAVGQMWIVRRQNDWMRF